MPSRRDVVEAADERADVGRADLRGKERLGRREDQRDVDPDAFVGERLRRPDAVARERHLDDDVLVNRREVAPFGDHPRVVGRDDLGADRALDDLADVLRDLPRVAALLRHERGIRRDAVDDAERDERLDFLEISGIDEEFHRSTCRLGPRSYCRPCPKFEVRRQKSEICVLRIILTSDFCLRTCYRTVTTCRSDCWLTFGVGAVSTA